MEIMYEDHWLDGYRVAIVREDDNMFRGMGKTDEEAKANMLESMKEHISMWQNIYQELISGT